MQSIGINRHELVTLVVPNGGAAGSYFFGDQPNIRDANVMNIEAVNQDQLAQDMSGNTAATAAQIGETTITLVSPSGVQFVHNLPLALLMYENAAVSDQLAKYLMGQKISWTKSFITTQFVAAADIAFNLSVIFQLNDRPR